MWVESALNSRCVLFGRVIRLNYATLTMLATISIIRRRLHISSSNIERFLRGLGSWNTHSTHVSAKLRPDRILALLGRAAQLLLDLELVDGR